MQLTDPNIKIVTVHASTSIRQLINSELRARGYQDVLGVPDLKSLVSVMEADPVKWVITPMILDEDGRDVFQLLRLVTDDLDFTDMRVSFLIDEGIDPMLLSKAFDMGLLSAHPNIKTKTDIEALLTQFFELEAAYENAHDLMAAHYLRRHLIQHELWTDLLRFERHLFQHHPGNLELAMHLAEAHLLNKDWDPAGHLLRQVKVIEPSVEPKVQELWQKYRGTDFEAATSDKREEHPGMLGLKSCMIVEPDSTQMDLLKHLLGQVGVQSILAFHDSAEALKHLEEIGAPELVLFEWRLQPITGPIFVQRAREAIGYAIPLTVMNADIQERDMPILREMGVTTRIKKPIEAQDFFRDLTWLIHQDRAPSEPFIIRQKIKQAMLDHDGERLANLTKRYLESGVSEGEKSLLQGDIAYYRGSFGLAKTMALKALKEGLASVDVLNLLGKAMMKTRDFGNALRCFENAQIISPSNVRRICNMAESHLENGSPEAYQSSLEDAIDLDPDAQAIKEVEVKAALMQGEGEKAKDLMQSLKSLMTILSFTNNRAIALIRCSQFHEGVQLYREALNAVPTEQRDIHSVLLYNLGLALARQNSLEEAKHLLQAAVEEDLSSKVKPKAKSLLARVTKSLERGERFALKEMGDHHHPNESEFNDPQKDLAEMMLAFRVGPGDLCLYKIHIEYGIDAKWKEKTERSLNLKKRSAININRVTTA